MRWFRTHIRRGSWLALVALAINFTLAFGHVHALNGSASEPVATLVAGLAGADGGGQSHPADSHADYLCPICMAAAAMGNALAPTPPALPVEFAQASIDRAMVSVSSIPQSPPAAFYSRGPPTSC